MLGEKVFAASWLITNMTDTFLPSQREDGASESTAHEAASAAPDGGIDEFRRFGHELIDWIADYLANPGRYPVLSQVEPNYLKNALPKTAPETGEKMDEMLGDVERLIVPGVTHWNHPCFFAYFATSASTPGILAELLSAAFNVNAMLWRTSPAATELEEVTLTWLRELMGLPETFGGVIYDTASISSLCAIAAARGAITELNIREYGFSGSQARLTLYTSEHSHSSIDKAAIILGVGQAGIRKIATDGDFRMQPAALARAIREDRRAGWRPFCVVATVGTTSTTSIDPVAQIAEISEGEGVWLHIDAAYAGSAAILPEMKWILEGSDRADSLVVNPHKWLSVPLDLSALFCRRMEVLRSAFSLVPEFLRSSSAGEVSNFMDYGPQLGRRFRALKLWFVMRYLGAEGLRTTLRRHLALAREFASWIDESPDFERMAPVPLSVVCFRARPAVLKEGGEVQVDSLNERLMEAVNSRGKVFLSHTRLNDRFALRLAIGNMRTTREHVKLAWDELNAALRGLNHEG